MNTNPAIIVVSLITGALVARSTFAEFAKDNGDSNSPEDLAEIAAELAKDGISKADHHLLIDITPTETEVVAWLKATRDASGLPISLGVDTNYHKPFYSAVREYSAPTQFGNTIAEAIANVRASFKTPAQLAEEKRAEAARLLAEADRLAPVEAEIVTA